MVTTNDGRRAGLLVGEADGEVASIAAAAADAVVVGRTFNEAECSDFC